MTLERLCLAVITALSFDISLGLGGMALGQCALEAGKHAVETEVARASCTAAGRADNSLPDAPEATLQQNPKDADSSPLGTAGTPSVNGRAQGRQTKRILYIIPNFRAVSADQKLPPQTIKDKFTMAALDSVDYSSFVFVAIQAGVAEARNSTPEFHHGASGYGRYYWHTYADYVDENLWVEFLLPAVLHQDPRYYTLGRGGFIKRLGYSVSRVVITRTDSGNEAFNASEIFGAGAASGISTLYYPSQERTFNKTYQLWLTSIAIDAASDLFKEFWPEINSKVFHQKD
jgi:hypothetical protein